MSDAKSRAKEVLEAWRPPGEVLDLVVGKLAEAAEDVRSHPPGDLLQEVFKDPEAAAPAALPAASGCKLLVSDWQGALSELMGMEHLVLDIAPGVQQAIQQGRSVIQSTLRSGRLELIE